MASYFNVPGLLMESTSMQLVAVGEPSNELLCMRKEDGGGECFHVDLSDLPI